MLIAGNELLAFKAPGVPRIFMSGRSIFRRRRLEPLSGCLLICLRFRNHSQ